MKFTYPIKLTADPEGGYIARTVDIPEALTFGEDQEAALHEARDAVHVALTAYIEDGQAISPPSPPRGRPAITLPALVAAKLALHQAMRDSGQGHSALAGKLGITEDAVRRLLDLDHAARIEQLEQALALLGRKLVVDVLAA